MLALALQQEDASASSRPVPRTTSGVPSTYQGAPVGDQAVALAIQQEERAMLNQRIDPNATAPNEVSGQALPRAESSWNMSRRRTQGGDR